MAASSDTLDVVDAGYTRALERLKAALRSNSMFCFDPVCLTPIVTQRFGTLELRPSDELLQVIQSLETGSSGR